MLHFYSPLKTSENRMGIAYNFSGTEQSHCHYYLFCANLRLYDGYLILYDCHFLLKISFHDFFGLVGLLALATYSPYPIILYCMMTTSLVFTPYNCFRLHCY